MEKYQDTYGILALVAASLPRNQFSHSTLFLPLKDHKIVLWAVPVLHQTMSKCIFIFYNHMIMMHIIRMILICCYVLK